MGGLKLRIGIFEILLIVIIATVILGPDKMLSAARSLGRGLKEAKEAYRDVAEEVQPIKEEFHDITSDLTDVVNDVKDFEPVEEQVVDSEEE